MALCCCASAVDSRLSRRIRSSVRDWQIDGGHVRSQDEQHLVSQICGQIHNRMRRVLADGVLVATPTASSVFMGADLVPTASNRRRVDGLHTFAGRHLSRTSISIYVFTDGSIMLAMSNSPWLTWDCSAASDGVARRIECCGRSDRVKHYFDGIGFGEIRRLVAVVTTSDIRAKLNEAGSGL